MPPTSNLDQLNTLVDIVVKIGAAFVGGWWFLRRSMHRVRLNLEQDVQVFRVKEEGKPDVTILKVLVKMQNIGEVPFSLDRLSVGAVRFLPLPELAVKHFSNATGVIDETLVEEDNSQGWTGLASVEGKILVELRPGELEVVPATLRTEAAIGDAQFAMVVSQVFEHPRWHTLLYARWYTRHPLCWKAQSLVPLREEEVDAVSQEKIVRTGNPIVIKVPSGGNDPKK